MAERPMDVFSCADGDFVLAIGTDGEFVKLCEVIGRSEWATDEPFAENPSRVRNNAALTPMLAEPFATLTRTDLMAPLDAAGAPCAPINAVPEVFDDSQVKHREMLRCLPHPLSGTVPQVVSPLRLAENPLSFDRPPPLLGQHTADVLPELGLDDAVRDALAKAGVTCSSYGGGGL